MSLLERLKVEYMVLGGFALPAYGMVRTTADLDVAVRIATPREFEAFLGSARESGFEPTLAVFSNPINLPRDRKTGLEVELWTRPGGVTWDTEDQPGNKFWNAFDGGGVIDRALSPVDRPDPCAPGGFSGQDIALNKPSTASNSLSDSPPSLAFDGALGLVTAIVPA